MRCAGLAISNDGFASPPRSVAPIGPRRHVTHGVLGHGRDGEAGVHPQIRRNDRSVDDVQIVVAECAAVYVDDTLLRGRAKRTTTEHVRRRRFAERNFQQATLRNAVHFRSHLLGDEIRDRNVGWHLRSITAIAVELRGERPIPTPAQAIAQVIVDRLHHEKNGRLPCPAKRHDGANRRQRVAQHRSDPTQPARHASAAIGKHRAEQAHRIGMLWVTHNFDVRFVIDKHAARDRDAFRVVHVLAARAHAEEPTIAKSKSNSVTD